MKNTDLPSISFQALGEIPEKHVQYSHAKALLFVYTS